MMLRSLFTILKKDTENIVSFDEFYSYMKKTDTNCKRFNLKRSLSKYNGGVIKWNDKDVLSLRSLLSYCLCNAEASEACRYIAENIENELLADQSDKICVQSTLDLYKLIAKATLHGNTSIIFDKDFEIEDTVTLLVEYKLLFTIEEWKQIVWFEYHFSKSPNYLYELNYENLLQLKYSYFQSLLLVREVRRQWNKVSKLNIRNKNWRFESADIDHQVQLALQTTHLPSRIDKDLISLFDTYCPGSVHSATCFDSVENDSVHILVCKTEKDGHIVDQNTLERAFFHIKRKHNLFIERIYVCDFPTLKPFTCEDETILRFHLRDAIETKSFNTFTHIWYAGQLIDRTVDHSTADSKCSACFDSDAPKPLTLNDFNILQEWYLELPAETQIILEGFINQNTLRRHSSPKQYYLKKLEKLYSVYDTILNLHNFKFTGLFQRSNTNELLLEYKSVSSVFDITAGSGITTSLRKAEDHLKKDANIDTCYFNTYLKQHAIKYTTLCGDVKGSASLRQCHLVLMLDNLVRLSYVTDPNPGESRSNQICTLPITLQGLPLDHKIIENWHLSDCDGSICCACKQQEKLCLDDVDRVLLTCHDDEEKAYGNYSKLMSFGYIGLWKKLPDNLLAVLDGYHEKCLDGDIEITDEDGIKNDGTDESYESKPEEDIDLNEVLELFSTSNETLCDIEDEDIDFVENDDEIQNMSGLETSFDQLSMLESEHENENELNIPDLLKSFDFEKYVVPTLLCRHPPPAMGRDDDITKIKEILEDVLLKLGYESDKSKMVNRILCGPDNKIGKCILKLMETNSKFKAFLPEFPLLHLRKSKITILFSAYKDAGILEILKYMKGEEQDDWSKLISIQHIDKATRYVKRIALALHLAFMIAFAHSLNEDDFAIFTNDMESEDRRLISDNWFERYTQFLEYGASRNATFALHVDIMRHCDHVCAIALSERLGGPGGYNLLLAAVKGSLLFSFVNNASSYAPYCVKLLYEHYSAGYFHKQLKQTLFSTPFKNSNVNFACDTKREMDHIEVLKGFRSGSKAESITCRMSLTDSLNKTSRQHESDEHITCSQDYDKLGLELTSVDELHIYPTTYLILTRNGLSVEESDIPLNVYSKSPIVLPISILDASSDGAGRFLLMRFLAKERMFQMSGTDIPSTEEIHGPKELIARAKRSTGVTIRRTLKSKVQTLKTERQTKEEKRQKEVAKETLVIDCFSSENSLCQVWLKADSSKPMVMKSLGMKRALQNLVAFCQHQDQCLQSNNPLISLNATSFPKEISEKMKICTIESAGVKFKLNSVKSGKEYLLKLEDMIKNSTKHAKRLSHLVVCEEKYSFTPDDFKANTRQQRTCKTKDKSVDHLKPSKSYLNENFLNKDIVTKTDY